MDELIFELFPLARLTWILSSIQDGWVHLDATALTPLSLSPAVLQSVDESQYLPVPCPPFLALPLPLPCAVVECWQ